MAFFEEKGQKRVTRSFFGYLNGVFLKYKTQRVMTKMQRLKTKKQILITKMQRLNY